MTTTRQRHRANPPTWIAAVRAAGVAAVAEAFGLATHRPSAGQRHTFACPACSASTRHPSRRDRRGAVGLTVDGRGWRCHQCGAGGDAVTLASYLAGEAGDVRGEAGARVRAELVRVGALLDIAGDGYRPQVRRARRDVAEVLDDGAAGPRYPPAAELRALLASCVDVDADTEAHLWAVRRGLDVARVVDLGTVRVVPAGAAVPRWCRGPRGAWTQTGHRLLAELYDASGALRSVHARAVIDAEPKGLSPAGFEVRGLVLACPLARRLLAGDDDARELVRTAAGLVICEGLPDWLTQQAAPSDGDATAPAVLGVLAGSWTPEHAARVPDGTAVLVATDHDDAGDKYAELVRRTFARRPIDLRRWKPQRRQTA